MSENDSHQSDDGPTTFDKVMMWIFLVALVIGAVYGIWALLMSA